jgi:hypothetical protein
MQIYASADRSRGLEQYVNTVVENMQLGTKL